MKISQCTRVMNQPSMVSTNQEAHRNSPLVVIEYKKRRVKINLLLQLSSKSKSTLFLINNVLYFNWKEPNTDLIFNRKAIRLNEGNTYQLRKSHIKNNIISVEIEIVSN